MLFRSDSFSENDYVNPFEKEKDLGEKTSMRYNTSSRCRTYGNSGSESELEVMEEIVIYKKKKPHADSNQHTNYTYRGEHLDI